MESASGKGSKLRSWRIIAERRHAVETIDQELGDGAPIAYLGDDLTDEDAFRSIKRGGLGVLVTPELRPTLVDVWLSPPQELLVFLERCAEGTGPHA